jgi:hypothetical protein
MKAGDMAPQQTGQPDSKLRVFISYSRDDLEFADQLDAALNVCGFECLIERHGISGGEDWKQRLGDLISWADAVVFVVSPSSARSEIMAWEVEEAARFSKRILPVRCRPFEGEQSSPLLRALNYMGGSVSRRAEFLALGSKLQNWQTVCGGGAPSPRAQSAAPNETRARA